MTGLILLAPGWPVWIVIVGSGIGGGMYGVLSAVTWPRYFGQLHLGAIRGMSMAIIVFGSAIGPWLFSQAQALTGSYAPVGWICLVGTLLLLLGSLKANNPQGRESAG